MLVITLVKKTTAPDGTVKLETTEPVKWKMMEAAPKLPDLLAADQVIVEADTSETWYIERRFANIPFVARLPNDKKIIWTGDIARFIVMNLVD